MGQDPSVIRAEIEETRDRVGDEVDALSYKTDVGARMGDYVEDKKEAVKSKVTGAVPDTRTIKRGAFQVRETAERNPVGLVIGGVAAGFILGTLVPKTRVENEQMGEMSDRLKDVAAGTAVEAAERGKLVAGEAVGAAVETAKELGREQSEELSSTLQDRAQGQSSESA
jgi:hypothetical protein